MRKVLVAAVTADGFIGRDAEQSSVEWTSGADKEHFRNITKELGTLVMGSRTFDTIGRALPHRRNIVLTSRPHLYRTEDVEAFDGSVQELIKKLEVEQVPSLAILGGAAVYSQFINAGLVDELYLTVESVMFGQGVSLLSETTDQRLRLFSADRIGENSLLLHYETER